MVSPRKNNTAVLVLDDGSVFEGFGFGAYAARVGEVCFNTSMTGYQEILTDASYAGQIITFTFPHIGNVGANMEDIETKGYGAFGLIVRADITAPSNYRASQHLHDWLVDNNVVGLSGIDTRALTRRIREKGAPKGVIAHNKKGEYDIAKLTSMATSWSGLEGLDLAKTVTTAQPYEWDQTTWSRMAGYGRQDKTTHKVVVIDFGIKKNILRNLANAGCHVAVVDAHTSAGDIMALNPDGIFLSNGPGDPAATGDYAVPTIQKLLGANIPMFGICLGHQMLALALGASTKKMHMGHRGGNHPVKDLLTGRVEITSQNHGFVVEEDTLPNNVDVTHRSLFDGTNEGLRVKGRPVFSVQYHPEASPGPHDSHYLFTRFTEMMDAA